MTKKKNNNYDLLIDAYSKNDVSEFSKLIDQGVKINCTNEHNESLISVILEDVFDREKVDVFINILLENNVSLKQIGIERPVLATAIDKYCKSNFLKKILKSNTDVNYFGVYKILPNGSDFVFEPPIFIAIDRCDDESINLLLKHNIDFDIENSFGESAINHLIERYCYEKKYRRLSVILEKFLEKGADPNKIGNFGYKAIHCLSIYETRQYLYDILFQKSLENSIDIDINAKEMFGDTALILSVKNSNLNGVKFLAKKGADLNIRGRWNCTPITISAILDNFKIFNYLLDMGADLLILDNDKNNILHNILWYKRYDESKHNKYFDKILKLHPELLNMRNIDGITPTDIMTKK